MFDPSWDEGCPSCTAGAHELSRGQLEHLHGRDTTFAYVSRAPFTKLEDYRRRRGWQVPVVLVARQRLQLRLQGHYRRVGRAGAVQLPLPGGLPPPRAGVELAGEFPGRSSFLRDGDRVYHTYSVYARGLETMGGSYYLLDETALGRQEEWEEPKGRAASVHGRRPIRRLSRAEFGFAGRLRVLRQRHPKT